MASGRIKKALDKSGGKFLVERYHGGKKVVSQHPTEKAAREHMTRDPYPSKTKAIAKKRAPMTRGKTSGVGHITGRKKAIDDALR